MFERHMKIHEKAFMNCLQVESAAVEDWLINKSSSQEECLSYARGSTHIDSNLSISMFCTEAEQSLAAPASPVKKSNLPQTTVLLA